MFKQAKLALAVLALGAAAAPALASPLYINTGSDFNLEPNGSTTTAVFDQMGYSGTLATSIYLGNPATPGTTVVDTNIPSIMNFYGFSAGPKTAIDGVTPLNFSYPNVPSQNNIDTLNNPQAPDLNGFTGGVADAVHQLRVLGEIDALRFRDVQHSVVGGKEDGGAGRKGGTEPLDGGIEFLQLVLPLF